MVLWAITGPAASQIAVGSTIWKFRGEGCLHTHAATAAFLEADLVTACFVFARWRFLLCVYLRYRSTSFQVQN